MASFGRRSASATSACTARALSAARGSEPVVFLFSSSAIGSNARAAGPSSVIAATTMRSSTDASPSRPSSSAAAMRAVAWSCKPDERLADRELPSCAWPACGPRLSASMRAWNSVASSAASFIRPRYVAANMRIGDHVHFVTAATDGGHLLLGQRRDRPSDRDLIQADAGAGRILQLDRGLHDAGAPRRTAGPRSRSGRGWSSRAADRAPPAWRAPACESLRRDRPAACAAAPSWSARCNRSDRSPATR